eukprot:2688194-Rhodomonas_salina.2
MLCWKRRSQTTRVDWWWGEPGENHSSEFRVLPKGLKSSGQLDTKLLVEGIQMLWPASSEKSRTQQPPFSVITQERARTKSQRRTENRQPRTHRFSVMTATAPSDRRSTFTTGSAVTM